MNPKDSSVPPSKKGESDRKPSQTVSSTARTAAASVLATLEGLSQADRGYVISRMTQYAFGKSARELRGLLKEGQAREKPSRDSQKKGPTPGSLRAQLEADADWRAYQDFVKSHKDDTPEKRAELEDTFKGLQAAAFRARASLKEARASKEEKDKEEETSSGGAKLPSSTSTLKLRKDWADEGPTK